MPDPLRCDYPAPADHAQLYELLVSELTDFVVFLTDPTGCIMSWNPGVEHILGYPEVEWLGQPAQIIFTPEDRAAGVTEQEMAMAAREGRAPDIRWHQCKDGSRIYVEGTLVALKDNTGQLLGFSKVMRDITGRKRAEEELASARDQAHTILESITDAFATFDPDWRFIYVNPVAERLLGRSREELIGQNHWDLFAPTQGTLIEQEYRRAVRDQVPVEFEVFYEPWQRWFAIKCYPTQPGGLSVYFRDTTDRKRVDEELRRQWHTFDAVLSHTPDHTYIIDSNGRFRYANAALLATWQKPLTAFVGKTLRELDFPPGVTGTVERHLQQVIATGQPLRDEIGFMAPGGQPCHSEYIFSPLFAADGTVEAVVGSSRDITERKQAEEIRQASEAQFRFLSQLDDVMRPLGSPQEITQMASQLLGEHLNVDHCAYVDIGEEEDTLPLTGDYTRGVPSRVGSYTLPPVGQELARLTRASLLYVVEDAEHDAHAAEVLGSYRRACLRAVISVPLHKAGQLVAGMAVYQNTPRQWRTDEVELVQAVANRCWESRERVRVTRALQASEQRLRLAQRAGRTGSFEWFIKADRIIWTPELEALYSLPEGGFEGTLEAWSRQVVPDDAERVRLGIADCLARQQAEHDYEFRALWPDGTTRWLRGQAQFFYDEAGTPERMIGVNIDIDAYKRAEETLRRANRELEEFAYVASHDLQEPLRTVNIYTQLLLRHSFREDAEAQEYAEFIRHSVTRMQELIRDLLSYSRIIHTDGLLVGTANLATSLAQALQTLQGRLEEVGASVQAGPLPIVQGDTAQLAHVFQNLLSNSLKYRHKAHAPAIHISAERNGEHWLISVQDNGIGFDPQYAERIFGLFKRLHRDEYPGTGLGLAICQRIVERYGGRMWAESQLGEGATFSFTLPQAEAT